MKKLLLTLIAVIPLMVFAQEETSSKKEKILSIVPQYVFQNGFKFDYEFTLKDDWKSWLMISPTLFISTDDSDVTSYSYENMRGLGIEVHHKYFMKEPDERKGFYFAYGGGFQFLSIKSEQFIDYTYTENGNDYISYKTDDVNTPINRLLLDIVVGKQIVRYKPFIIDGYLGVGFRYSVNKDFEMIDNFNDTWFDYGYSGSLIVAGVKFGFNFSK